MSTAATKKYFPLPFLSGLIALLLVLSFIPTSSGPALEAIMSRAGLEALNSAALDQLHDQREQAFNGFVVLSALKVGLAVLRSSEIGLILNIRIGDLAVAAYDYVNLGWKVLLAAVAYFYLAEYFLAFTGLIDMWVLQIALITLGMVLFLGFWQPGKVRLRGVLKRIGIVSLVLSMVLYLALPLSFVVSGWVSSRITGESIDESGRILEDTRKGMPGMAPHGEGASEAHPSAAIRTPSVTVPFPYDGSDPSRVTIEDPAHEGGGTGAGRVFFSGDQLVKLKNYLEGRSRSLASAVLRQTSAYLFNVVLVPLVTILVLFWGTKFAVSLILLT